MISKGITNLGRRDEGQYQRRHERDNVKGSGWYDAIVLYQILYVIIIN